jgi:hypothetical protein
MTRLVLLSSLAISLLSLAGCATGTNTTAAVAQQETGSGDYCHKKLQPVGPSDLLRRNQTSGDVIDYYGPCDGPSLSDQIQQQKRFESFRFGKEYMDEG